MAFNGFEDYCRAKWEFIPRKAYYLIAAASLFTQLCTNCADRKPERESQLRSLLSLEQNKPRLPAPGRRFISAAQAVTHLRPIGLVPCPPASRNCGRCLVSLEQTNRAPAQPHSSLVSHFQASGAKPATSHPRQSPKAGGKVWNQAGTFDHLTPMADVRPFHYRSMFFNVATSVVGG